MNNASSPINQQLAQELNIRTQQVDAVLALLETGATVPFIARYRKEATGGLDDTQLRQLTERHSYVSELEQRRQSILKSITEQEKLTPELRQAILNADNKTRLEDLYLPYKPKRRSKAMLAREAGLQPLAEALCNDPTTDPKTLANNYLNPEHKIEQVEQALEGARHIIIEQLAENAELLQSLREHMWRHAVIQSTVVRDHEMQAQKFKDYFCFHEALGKIPSHRILALFRGRKEEHLQLQVSFPDTAQSDHCLQLIADTLPAATETIQAQPWLWKSVQWAWKTKIQLKLELEIMNELKQRADDDAISVFKNNLKNLLLAAPAGKKIVLGLDPGFRSGVKTVVIDDTGKLLHHCVIFPHQPQQQWDQALAQLYSLCKKFQVELVSIGNGTASRETDQLVTALTQAHPELKLTQIVVSEAGASVYSASAEAAKEFPELDVSYRGAVSIARRLQDPLAELVKIEPKAIGVGQYQHDVNQNQLAQSLQNTMEDCVNAVGADVNTASAPLLTTIAGLNQSNAQQIILYREQHGRFKQRSELLNVPRMGQKTFEQCAGFLRIMDGNNPLDSSAVHPESYPVVDRIARHCNTNIKQLLADSSLLESLNAADFCDQDIGLLTIRDIIEELKKPGRDPRPEFKTAQFSTNIKAISDLKPGLKLEGVITNVANFGAFVDIGVHQDGLVHISEVANHYVKDIHQVLQVGQIVQVSVLEVDANRKRIQLSMKQQASAKTPSPGTSNKLHAQDRKAAMPEPPRTKTQQATRRPQKQRQKATSDLADKLLQALKK